MNFYCMNCSGFTNNKNKNDKVKHEIDGKIKLYSCCIGYGFKEFTIIDEIGPNDILKEVNAKKKKRLFNRRFEEEY